mgnify:CR=1 FL=1
MKQGRRYTTLILWIFLAAIVAYLGYHVSTLLRDPYTTTTAIEYEAGAGHYATGFVVRDETPIASEYDITTVTAAEGARVAANGVLATGYLTADAQARQTRIAQLHAQIEQLGYAGQYTTSVADQAALDTAIGEALTQMTKFLERRDMNSIQDGAAELKGMILRRESSDADAELITRQLENAQQELTILQSAAEQDTAEITAPKAGYFSAVVDGYETVLTPERLDTLTVREYDELQPEDVGDAWAGKLISGDRWYFVTSIPAGELAGVEAGDRVRVTFARDFYSEITMTVTRVGQNEAGFRLLVLSSREFMQSVTLLREQTADVVFIQYTGLRVPKDAVYVDESGQPGVYILESARARWKPITILHDNGESYVVELDKTKTENLWPGDEILVGAKNLYDGKVVG